MKAHFFDEESGWEEGQRVPLARSGGFARADGSMAESAHDFDGFFVAGSADGSEEVGVVPGSRGSVWWPSEEDPRLELVRLSREEAGRVSAAAREGLFLWMAGAGLHGSEVLARYGAACARLRPTAALLPEMLRAGLRGPAWERWTMEGIFPGRNWRRAWNGVQDRLRVLAREGRYAVLGDDRRLEEVMDWAAAESGDWGPDGEIEARAVAVMAMGALLDWLGEDGAGVLQVVQRFYGLLFERYQGAMGTDLSGADLMGLVGQVRATFCELTNRLFEEPLEARLGYRPKVAGQKSVESSAKYAANARRHVPRRQLGGCAGLAREERSAMEATEARLLDGAAMERLERAKAEARRREVERDAAAMEAMARRNRERAREGRGR